MKKVRKVVLCGATSVEETNFGDVLLEDLLVERLKKDIPRISVSKFEKHDTIKNLLWKYIKTDLFIYVPGGYMGYIEKWYSGSFTKSMQRYFYYYLPGLLYRLTRKPIVLLGQGIGPYEYPLLGIALKKISNYASLITVRDKESYSLLRKVGCKNNIIITADCSQVLRDYDLIWECTESNRIRSLKNGRRVMFVLFFNTPTWKTKILEALDRFMNEDYYFVISSDGIVADRNEFVEFVEHFPKESTLAVDYRSPRQLLSILNEVDIVVTPKLHTGIVSCVLSKSVFAFASQFNKTQIYYNKIGYPERVRDLDSISANEMRELIEKYQDVKIQIPQEIINEAENNYRLLDEYIYKLNNT